MGPWAAIAAAFALSAWTPPSARAQFLFTENFDVNHTANWRTNAGVGFNNAASISLPQDWSADYFFDYSSVGIPSAPNSVGGSTRGLKMQADLVSNALGGFSASPIGQSFSGDYTVKFDMWASTVGPFPVGSNGSTNLSTMGVMTSGTVSNTIASTDGVFFGATGDGNTLADYRAYAPERLSGYVTPSADPLDAHATYAAGSRNADAALYTGAFPAHAPPAAQQSLYPGVQTGFVAAGSFGLAWRQVEIEVKNEVVSWTVDGTLLVTVDTSDFAVPVGGGNISFGHADINATSSSDPLAGALLFTLVDNIRVDPTAASWLSATSGIFQETNRWQNNYVPNQFSPTQFNVAGTYTVTVNENKAIGGLSVKQGNVTFELSSASVPQTLTVNSRAIEVSGSTLTVRTGTLAQAQVANSERFVVGPGGTLNVANGGTINSGGGNVAVGTTNGATATASVNGLNSKWIGINQLTIGATTGSSTVSVKNQATMAVGNTVNVRSSGALDLGAGGNVNQNGFVNIGASGPATLGAVRLGAGGVLSGSGAITGNVLNVAGRLRPGNSPGKITINGDYTQSGDATLEIEVAGIPEADHDLVVVTPPGIATLDGTLDVPLLGNFTPTVGQEFTFLTAATINGSFSSFKSKLPANMAIRIGNAPVGPLQARQIQFVSTVTEIELKPQETPGPLNWNNADTTWKNIANNDPARVPDMADIISVSNNSGADREVQVQSTNAFVNQLALLDSDDEFKVTVTGGRSLSAVDSATIGENAIISLDNGNFVSAQVDVTAGGTITGNGAIKTDDLVVGATLSDEPAKFKPGLNGVGTTSIEGDYTQGAGGELTIDVASNTQFDKINLQGTADFGGTLVVNVTNDATVQPGSIIQIVTATGLIEDDAFDLVRTEGSIDTVFVPIFTPGAVNATVSLQGLPRGDLNLDGVFNPAADAAALAQAFTNPAAYKLAHQGTSGAIMGNVNNDDYFDFDDITAFRLLAGMTVAELAHIFSQAARIPEPGSFVLLSVALLAFRPTSCRRRR